KEKITITLDKELVNRLKSSNTKISTLINHLLYKHYSQVSLPQSQSFRLQSVRFQGSNPCPLILNIPNF
ncbi:MAG: hypothetical protein KC550_01190, partial [Nanoarchaeota archaeon]|nr:hypothetical protein [Nanoarchaeota archaeon]